ncbi:lytic transglycosylase domain-containing protein [Campylobacter cuniculorum]|uniref:Soluble lytic murein transglycosylase n=2 Tax=Campylobacter cuniculorum TaxID=374106 RepID=A0A1W6BWY6_9BACT|nr:lytic transglycosylase domain-containing protein [Campylobacter cuniculorum]ARJ56623.1 soluble lytic murein transglycosylase [Campylobacter cuniculorum DSM 23162 = LMG 24588]QOR04097.1 lytic transglycosylase domain-containing protein [Campylobacter cuniculorum]
MKKILILSLLTLNLLAYEYSLETLKKQENSLAKDYYIYRLLEKKSLNAKEVQTLKTHIFRYAGKIKTELNKIIAFKPYIDPQIAACYNYTKQTILDANLTCQNERLKSLAFISSLAPQTRTSLAQRLNSSKPDLSNLLLAFNTPNPMAYIAQKEDTNGFFRLYNYSKKMDTDLNASFINKIAAHPSFKNFAQGIIIKKENPKFRHSLLQIKPQSVTEDSAFYLGVNALVCQDEALAYEFFKKAYESFKMQENKDNALFWMWLIKKDPILLENLAQSETINIYSLYAKELLNKALPHIIIPNPSKEKNSFNMQDPFAWQKLFKEIKNADEAKLLKLADEFNTKETLAVYTIIMERISKFKKNYFIMPYYEYIKDYDTARQAFILAIARQESRFIPTAISTSYALGIMQFMPFLANHINNKELKIPNFDQDFMFEPKIAYEFGNHHLDYLQSRLKSPLFIAYAYNGGIGFTNKMLAREDMFKPGKFEPFLSMELVPYQESRIYGKKVLANYIVYRHLLNDNIKISSIFQNSIQSN